MFIEKEPLEVVTSTVRLPITQQGEKVRILFTLKIVLPSLLINYIYIVSPFLINQLSITWAIS